MEQIDPIQEMSFSVIVLREKGVGGGNAVRRSEKWSPITGRKTKPFVHSFFEIVSMPVCKSAAM